MLEHFYTEDKSRNFGVILSIEECDDVWDGKIIHVSVIGSLHESCCRGFVPQIGMRVELFVDSEGWVLQLAK